MLIGWTAPDNTTQLESYHVYVDGVLKVTVKATERTRALVEGVDSTRVSDNNKKQVTTTYLYINYCALFILYLFISYNIYSLFLLLVIFLKKKKKKVGKRNAYALMKKIMELYL